MHKIKFFMIKRDDVKKDKHFERDVQLSTMNKVDGCIFKFCEWLTGKTIRASSAWVSYSFSKSEQPNLNPKSLGDAGSDLLLFSYTSLKDDNLSKSLESSESLSSKLNFSK